MPEKDAHKRIKDAAAQVAKSLLDEAGKIDTSTSRRVLGAATVGVAAGSAAFFVGREVRRWKKGKTSTAKPAGQQPLEIEKLTGYSNDLSDSEGFGLLADSQRVEAGENGNKPAPQKIYSGMVSDEGAIFGEFDLNLLSDDSSENNKKEPQVPTQAQSESKNNIETLSVPAFGRELLRGIKDFEARTSPQPYPRLKEVDIFLKNEITDGVSGMNPAEKYEKAKQIINERIETFLHSIDERLKSELKEKDLDFPEELTSRSQESREMIQNLLWEGTGNSDEEKVKFGEDFRVLYSQYLISFKPKEENAHPSSVGTTEEDDTSKGVIHRRDWHEAFRESTKNNLQRIHENLLQSLQAAREEAASKGLEDDVRSIDEEIAKAEKEHQEQVAAIENNDWSDGRGVDGGGLGDGAIVDEKGIIEGGIAVPEEPKSNADSDYEPILPVPVNINTVSDPKAEPTVNSKPEKKGKVKRFGGWVKKKISRSENRKEKSGKEKAEVAIAVKVAKPAKEGADKSRTRKVIDSPWAKFVAGAAVGAAVVGGAWAVHEHTEGHISAGAGEQTSQVLHWGDLNQGDAYSLVDKSDGQADSQLTIKIKSGEDFRGAVADAFKPMGITSSHDIDSFTKFIEYQKQNKFEHIESGETVVIDKDELQSEAFILRVANEKLPASIQEQVKDKQADSSVNLKLPDTIVSGSQDLAAKIESFSRQKTLNFDTPTTNTSATVARPTLTPDTRPLNLVTPTPAKNSLSSGSFQNLNDERIVTPQNVESKNSKDRDVAFWMSLAGFGVGTGLVWGGMRMRDWSFSDLLLFKKNDEDDEDDEDEPGNILKKRKNKKKEKEEEGKESNK